METFVDFYSKSGLAQKLGVSTRTVDNWIAEGKIGFTKIGRRILFTDKDIKLLIEKNHREAFYYLEN